MTNHSRPAQQYSGSVLGPEGEEVMRLSIVDSGANWVFEFGVDGENVGLYSVTVSKFRVGHLNMLGALEVALRDLMFKKKEAREAGRVLYSYRDTKEIDNG